MSSNQPIAMYVPSEDDFAEARTTVLRHVDTFADWLLVECCGSTQIQTRPVLRGKTAEDFKTWPVGSLVALTLDLAQPSDTRAAANNAIAERYLADDDTQAEVIRVANKLMLQRFADERVERQERRAEHARRMDMPALALVADEA